MNQIGILVKWKGGVKLEPSKFYAMDRPATKEDYTKAQYWMKSKVVKWMRLLQGMKIIVTTDQ